MAHDRKLLNMKKKANVRLKKSQIFLAIANGKKKVINVKPAKDTKS